MSIQETKTYQIQQRTGEDTYRVLHPETDASVVKVDTTGFYGIADPNNHNTAQKAIKFLHNRTAEHSVKLNSLPEAFVTGVKGDAETEYRTGQVNITKVNIGLGNVNNTADMDKPVSIAQQEQFTAQGNRITALENQIGGVTGAMHFLGTTSTAVSDGKSEAPTISNEVIATADLKNGDVVLYGQQEYVWNGTKWELFGDEGSYALKTTKVNNKALSGDVTLYATDIELAEQGVYAGLTIFEQFTAQDTSISNANMKAETAREQANTNASNITKIIDGTTKVGKAGTADSATEFADNQNITLTGDVTGTVSSKAGWSIATTLKDSGVTADTYSAVQVNTKGIVTAGGQFIEVGGTEPTAALAVKGIFFKALD